MTLSRCAFALWFSLLLPGCFLFHFDESPPRRDSGVGRDAGVRRDVGFSPDVGRSDAGRRDAGRDAAFIDVGPADPPTPDPDLGPDARPSDYAEDWVDPPVVGDDESCCLVGPVVRLASREEGFKVIDEAPHIAWGPGYWGVLAQRQSVEDDWEALDAHPILFELDADGTPRRAPHVLESPIDGLPRVEALAWAEGRWSIALGGAPIIGDIRQIHVRLFDAEIRPASAWLPVGEAGVGMVDVARITHGDRWIATHVSGADLDVTPFSDLGTDHPEAHESLGRPATVDAVALRSRIAVLLGRRADTPQRSELIIIGPPPEVGLMHRLELSPRADLGASLTALRDLVVAVGTSADGHWFQVLDPFIPGPVAPAGRLPGGVDLSWTDAISVAGSSKFGLAGVCYGGGPSEGRDTAGRVDFQLIRTDGTLYGRPVSIVDGSFRGGMVHCAVGSDDYGFLVAWHDGVALYVRRVDIVSR